MAYDYDECEESPALEVRNDTLGTVCLYELDDTPVRRMTSVQREWVTRTLETVESLATMLTIAQVNTVFPGLRRAPATLETVLEQLGYCAIVIRDTEEYDVPSIAQGLMCGSVRRLDALFSGVWKLRIQRGKARDGACDSELQSDGKPLDPVMPLAFCGAGGRMVRVSTLVTEYLRSLEARGNTVTEYPADADGIRMAQVVPMDRESQRHGCYSVVLWSKYAAAQVAHAKQVVQVGRGAEPPTSAMRVRGEAAEAYIASCGGDTMAAIDALVRDSLDVGKRNRTRKV